MLAPDEEQERRWELVLLDETAVCGRQRPGRDEAGRRQVAQFRAKAARGCAKAYMKAFGGLFDGDSVSAQAETVRKDL
jgi:hypothetical protein